MRLQQRDAGKGQPGEEDGALLVLIAPTPVSIPYRVPRHPWLCGPKFFNFFPWISLQFRAILVAR